MCKILGQEDIKPHKVRYYLQRRDAEFEQKMAEDRLAKARMRGDGPPYAKLGRSVRYGEGAILVRGEQK